MKVTSAYANKMLRKLQEDKEYWLANEANGCTYVVTTGEEPLVPDYDYETVNGFINEIDEKIVRIKHTINVVNATNEIAVGDKKMSIDAILVRMAQLNSRKRVLDTMRKRQPKSRVDSGSYYKAPKTEYKYINYDLTLIKKEYEALDTEIAVMQIALDKFNQTFEFEVED